MHLFIIYSSTLLQRIISGPFRRKRRAWSLAAERNPETAGDANLGRSAGAIIVPSLFSSLRQR
jgi:hypothetical protein